MAWTIRNDGLNQTLYGIYDSSGRLRGGYATSPHELLNGTGYEIDLNDDNKMEQVLQYLNSDIMKSKRINSAMKHIASNDWNSYRDSMKSLYGY